MNKQQCPICGKIYSGKTELRNHMSYHEQKFKLKCDQCPYMTNYQNSMKDHKRCHLREQGQKSCLTMRISKEIILQIILRVGNGL